MRAPLGSQRLPGLCPVADAAGSRSRHVERSFHVEGVEPAEAFWVPAGAAAGRAGSALHRPASSAKAPRCSRARLLARPKVGCDGGFPKCAPHLHCSPSAVRTSLEFLFFLPLFPLNISLFMLNTCCKKNSGRQLLGEEAVAGRICIGCVDFWMEGGGQCCVSLGPGSRGRHLCAPPAQPSLLSPPWNSVLKSSNDSSGHRNSRVATTFLQNFLKVRSPFISTPPLLHPLLTSPF